MPKKTEHTIPGPRTLQEAITFFASEDNCLTYLVAMRWPEGVECPTCGCREVSYLKNQKRWKCRVKHERQQFSIKVGTIMEDSAIPLSKWLPAMWMIANCKNGISSYELARGLDITQKTAWFLLHRIRLAMHDEEPGMLSGTVEADETYIGGKARYMHKERKERMLAGGRGTAGKSIVVGMLERGDKKEKGKKQEKFSKVRAIVTKGTSREILHKEVRQSVQQGSELMTDEHSGYEGLEKEYIHRVINHAEAYVQGHVYTNGIENFWTLLKRTIKGTYVAVEPYHLFRYLDEQSFRFNDRKETDGERFNKVLGGIEGKRLDYRHLTGTATPEPPLA